MSCTSFFTVDYLMHRGRKEGIKGTFTMPAGVKAAAKKALHRAERQSQNRQLLAEMTAIADSHAVHLLDARVLEDLADQFLAQAELPAVEPGLADWDALMSDGLPGEGDDDYPNELPAELYASLPDWMVQRLEAAGGSAFEMLTLLETRQTLSPSKQFIVSREDDGYADEDN